MSPPKRPEPRQVHRHNPCKVAKSGLESNVHYTGGAHPNTGYRSLICYWTGRKLRRLELKDLFRKGAAYQEVLLQNVTAVRRTRRTAWILDGSVTLNERDLGVFNLTHRGLFTFAPYAVVPLRTRKICHYGAV